MMISSFRSDSIPMPYVISLLGALHAREITAKEYYGTRHVAALEDSSRKLFYRVRWSEVREGDTFLLAVREGAIVEAVVEEIGVLARNGRDLLSVAYKDAGRLYKGFRWPDATVYVQSRF